MKIQAVLFDIYNTLLEVNPPPADVQERWGQLWRKFRSQSPPLSLEEFDRRCRQRVAVSHARDKAKGIAFPEVDWPAMAQAALPELAQWPDLPEFLFEHAQLVKTVHLMPGVGEVLQRLCQRQIPMGLCSNCQAYSLRELDQALGGIGLGLSLFHRPLCFLSFEFGFSKPNPKVFRILQERLENLGLFPGQILMVGDRQDNDIDPARAQGWQTWRLTRQPLPEQPSGDWKELNLFLAP